MTQAIVAARVIRVVTGNATATLVHAIDDGGLDQKARAVARPGPHDHARPGADPSVVGPRRPGALERAGVPVTQPPDPLDHEFDIRIDSPAPAAGARDILDEFNALLGLPRRKG
jgi:hypothetical protein